MIATRIGGFFELIHHKKNGILIEPNNLNELIDAILYLIENEGETKRICLEASKLIEEKSRMDIMVGKLEKVYEEIKEKNK